MDGFKKSEILRMEHGGNGRWMGFWEERTGEGWGRGPAGGGDGGAGGVRSEGGGKEEFERRYGGVVGEEWKERLSCLVEGREFDEVGWRREGEEKRRKSAAAAASKITESAHLDSGAAGVGTGRSQKEMNEDFFARKGNENERRRADLPPSQGGKYAGFGSAPMPMSSSSSMSKGVGEDGGRGIPGVDEFQNDPVAALTKGFGWFTTTVGKSAKSVNDGWIQPNVQKVRIHIVVSPPRCSPLSLSFSLLRIYFYIFILKIRETLTYISCLLRSSKKPTSRPKPASPPPKSHIPSKRPAKQQPSISTASSRTPPPPLPTLTRTLPPPPPRSPTPNPNPRKRTSKNQSARISGIHLAGVDLLMVVGGLVRRRGTRSARRRCARGGRRRRRGRRSGRIFRPWGGGAGSV